MVLSNTGYTRLDLDNGVFQVGKDSVNYVHLEPDGITWRGGQDMDGATAHGQIKATADRLWITSDTRYQMLGWRHESSGSYQCLEIEPVSYTHLPAPSCAWKATPKPRTRFRP